MYRVRRLYSYEIMEFSEYYIYSHKISKIDFIFNDNDFKKLQNIVELNEYEYEYIPNVFFLDVSPHVLEEFDDDFVKDYSDNLNDKFYVCYLYEVLNE